MAQKSVYCDLSQAPHPWSAPALADKA
jgi:hypothetical protein